MVRNADTTPVTSQVLSNIFEKCGYSKGYFSTVFTSPTQSEYIMRN